MSEQAAQSGLLTCIAFSAGSFQVLRLISITYKDDVLVPSLESRKLKLRESKSLSQVHRVDKGGAGIAHATSKALVFCP